MSLDFLVDAAIAQFDWSKMQEISGPATSIPVAFKELLASTTPEATTAAYWKLENHVVVQGGLFDSAIGVVSLIGAAMVDTKRPRWVRIGLLELLFQIVAGCSAPNEVPDLGPRCRIEARKFIWILYGIFQEGEFWETAREIIECIDDDHSMLATLDRLNRENGRFDIHNR